MFTSADALRRWFGLLFLALAFGMLIWGEIVLRDKLHGIAYLIYWAICFVFTLAAIITALLDMRATRKRARAEHNALLEKTLKQLEAEQKEKE